MPDRILYHTWSIRTLSPFTIPLLSSGVTLNAVEDQLTSFVRQKTSDAEQGTYTILAWIVLSPSQRHLHIDVRLQEEPVANILLCFPNFEDDTAIRSFSFAMQRGSKILCDTVIQWLESTSGCVFGNHPFSPTPDQVAHALAVWTTYQLDEHSRPLEVTFEAPETIAKAGLSKLSLSVPPVAVARLLQDIKDNNPSTQQQQDEQQDLPILRALQCFIRETYKLRIESFSLVRAHSAAAVLGCDGRCKPLEKNLLENVLLEIQSMIQSQLRIQPTIQRPSEKVT